MTVHDLTRLLEQRKVMYKQSGQWMLYADYARKGYAKSRTHSHYDAEGDLHTRTYLVWTEEGRRFIHWICSDEEIIIPFLLSVPGERFEYEMGVLIRAARTGVPMAPVPIRTIYENGNAGTHYRPFVDTVRINWRVFAFSPRFVVMAILFLVLPICLALFVCLVI